MMALKNVVRYTQEALAAYRCPVCWREIERGQQTVAVRGRAAHRQCVVRRMR